MKEGCICSSWKTSVGRRQQTVRVLRTPLGPFFSEKTTHQNELLSKCYGGIDDSYSDGAQVHWLLDDVVIVMKAQSHYVNRGIEGPCTCIVSL